MTLDGQPYNTNQAGAFKWSRESDAGPDFVNGVDSPYDQDAGTEPHLFDPPNNEFITFCIELTEHIMLPQDYTGLSDIAIKDAPQSVTGGNQAMGWRAADAIADLWFNYLDDALQNRTNAAAFQLAIWELDYDGTADLTAGGVFDLTSGRFGAAPSTTMGDVADIAQKWLDSLTTSDIKGTGKDTDLRGITMFDADGETVLFQDQVSEVFCPPQSRRQ